MPYQCDCCGQVVHRVHFLVAYGMDTQACDACVDYDAEAYGEPTEAELAEEAERKDLLDQMHDREEAWREAQHNHWSCYPGCHKEG